MNFNDYRINAYKKNIASPSEKKDDDSNSYFQKSTKSEIDSNSSQKHKSINDILDKRFFPQLNGNFQGNESARVAAKALTSGGLIKVPEKEHEADGKENIYRRVAKFLMLIGVDEAAKILPHLTEEQTEKIIPEIASIRYVEPEEAKEILEEFQSLVKQAREEGGLETARAILEKAFGSHKAGQILEKTATLTSGKPFEFLAEADGERVSLLLKDESNAVKALVLSFLNPKVSAEVINSLPADDKKDVVLRLAKFTKVSPEIVQRVDKALQEKMNHMATSKSDSIDGKSVLAQILKRMSPQAEETILDSLSDQDPDLGEDLRERLFTSEDIIAADDRFIQEKLRNMYDEEIAYLIAAKTEDFREEILSNVSENRRKSILETENFLHPMRRSDCDKATSQFFSLLRRAWENGELYIKGRDDDKYV